MSLRPLRRMDMSIRRLRPSRLLLFPMIVLPKPKASEMQPWIVKTSEAGLRGPPICGWREGATAFAGDAARRPCNWQPRLADESALRVC